MQVILIKGHNLFHQFIIMVEINFRNPDIPVTRNTTSKPNLDFLCHNRLRKL